MIIEMNGVERKLKFKLGFVRKIDKMFRGSISGIYEFGAGIQTVELQIEQRNPAVLSDVIFCAIENGSTMQAVDNFVDDYADEHGDLEPLFEEVREALGKSPQVRATLKALRASAEVEMEKMEKQTDQD